MRDIQILQQTIENQCPEIHKKRLSSLILATKAVLDGSDLTLTKIGRALDTDTTESNWDRHLNYPCLMAEMTKRSR